MLLIRSRQWNQKHFFIKKGLQCGKKNFPEKKLIESLWMWDLNLTIDVSISKYVGKHEHY